MLHTTTLCLRTQVLFVSCAYSPAKHQGALKKLGVQPGSVFNSTTSSNVIQTQGAAGAQAVTFVSAADAVRQATSASSSAAVGEQQQQPPQQQQSVSCLQVLMQQVHAAAQQLVAAAAAAPNQQHQHTQQQHGSSSSNSSSGGGGCCGLTVIVDSLPCLAALAAAGDDCAGGETNHHHNSSSGSHQVVQALLQQLIALGEQLPVGGCPYRLVLLAARDVPSQSTLLRSLSGRCHVTADISPLEGKTAALDGSMTLTLRRAPPTLTTTTTTSAAAAGGGAGAVGGRGVVSSGSSRMGEVGSQSVWLFRCGDVGLKWVLSGEVLVDSKQLMMMG